jgi:hypothetical protein
MLKCPTFQSPRMFHKGLFPHRHGRGASGVQHRLRLYKANGQVAAAIPGSSVSVHQAPEGGLAIVNVPWIGSALVVEPSERERMTATRG